MPDLAVLGPLLVFTLMACLVAYVLWRGVTVAGDIRGDVELRAQLTEIVRRADTTLTELASVVDDVRHRRTEAETAEPMLSAAIEAVDRYRDEAGSIVAWPPSSGVRDALVADLERAGRAIDMVDHGCRMMANGNSQQRAEGETSVKRGYLGIIHARSALHVHLDEMTVAVERRRLTWRRRAH
jgi:hypothetical protein